MKFFARILAVVVLVSAISMGAMAQKKAVNTAIKSISSGKLDVGASNIDMAVENPETMSLSATWVVRGDVYTAIAGNPLFAKRYENAAQIALDSYKKAIELDGSDKTKVTLSLKMPNLADVYYDMGTESFSAGDFEKATNNFEKSFECNYLVGTVDSASMFNIALCAANANLLEKAEQNYKALVDGAYPLLGIYNGLADVYVRAGKTAEVAPLMNLMLERFAEDSNAYTTAVGVLLGMGDNAAAEEVLNKAISIWPESAFLYLAMGVAFENSNQFDKAETAYKKALELNSEYPEAIYNLGALYVNMGIKTKTEADKLPLEETAKYDELTAKANSLFESSVPYLEKIIEAQPNNIDALQTLRSIYTQLKQNDKAKAIKDKIDSLSAE